MSFDEYARQWAAMPKKTEEEDSLRDDFYIANIFPSLARSFKAKPGHSFKGLIGCEYMILTVGSTLEPLVLSINYIKPKKILLLHTDGTKSKVDKIIACLNLPYARLTIAEVDKSNVIDLYQAVIKQYEAWNRPKNILVDFTGGTKAMAAAAAMAGAMIDAELVYVGNKEYDSSERRPVVGAEHMERIANPYEILGSMEYEKALSQMRYCNYNNALMILTGILKIKGAYKSNYEQLYNLASAYNYWDNLEFAKANECMSTLYNDTESYVRIAPKTALCEHFELIGRQRDILKILAEHQKELLESGSVFAILRDKPLYIAHLLFSIFTNAKRKVEQEKLELASLLLYRLLEMIAQRRLAIHSLREMEKNNRPVSKATSKH